MDQQTGIFYHLGKGVFWALLVFALPCWYVVNNYGALKEKYDRAANLPIFEELQNNFKTGAELAGATFLSKLNSAWADSTAGPEFHTRASYWDRTALENTIAPKLGRRNSINMQAYLAYVEEYKNLAILEMKRSRIPASVILAQGILETDAGRSKLARKANNHFGIKCRARAGFRRDGAITQADFNFHSLAVDCMQMTDDYTWDRFEVYPSPRESYRRHSLLLREQRYRWMFDAYDIGGKYNIPNSPFGARELPYYAAWAVGLKRSGYATSPVYAQTLTFIIETYQLWRIDYELIMA